MDRKQNCNKRSRKADKQKPTAEAPGVPPRRFDWFWLLLIVVPPLLLFPRLGQTYLWQDEAETALLGQAVLEHGYPLAVGGKHLISDQPGQADVNAAGIWIWTPWLQDYVAAVSFALFGLTTWAARFPFALLGWVVPLITYAALNNVTKNRTVSRYTAILVVASIPFLLHARQCRYYMLLALFTMLHAWGYVRLTRQARGGAWLFITGGIGLYHSFFPQLLASTIAMAAHTFFFHRNRSFFSRFALCLGVIGAGSLPFFIYTNAWSRNYEGAGYGFDDLGRYLATLRAYLLQVHVYCWPFSLVLLVICKRRTHKGAPGRRNQRMRLTILALSWLVALCAPPSGWSFALLVIVVVLAGIDLTRWLLNAPGGKTGAGPLREELALLALLLSVSVILFAGICNYPFYRYLIGLLPLFAAATAATVVAVGSSRRWGAAALTACLVACNIVQLGPFTLATGLAEAIRLVSKDQYANEYGYLPSNMNSSQTLMLIFAFPRLRSLAWEYAQEITHDYLGPIGAVVQYLSTHAQPDDVLVTTYEHFPLMFYTNLRVFPARASERLADPPDWVFVHGEYASPFPDRLAQAVRNPKEYQQVPIAAREFSFENIPEPNWHRFRTPTGGPPVSLFHRVR